MSRRSGLGRGLDALLPSEERDRGEGLLRVPVDAIAPNPLQPRKEFDDEELNELARSITVLGILQPLLVRDSGRGRYELIAGERRLRASKLAGLSDVPVLVVETDERIITYPRDWFRSDSDQRRVSQAIHRKIDRA